MSLKLSNVIERRKISTIDFLSILVCVYRILGLYTTAVIVISQMMRKIVSDMAPKIMFDDLPYVDRILRLCLDIYLVRESGELCLEEDLFAKLIFLYRSPETLIRLLLHKIVVVFVLFNSKRDSQRGKIFCSLAFLGGQGLPKKEKKLITKTRMTQKRITLDKEGNPEKFLFKICEFIRYANSFRKETFWKNVIGNLG